MSNIKVIWPLIFDLICTFLYLFIMSEKEKQEIAIQENVHGFDVSPDGEVLVEPTAEDYKNLREVSDHIPKAAYLVILIEFCERFTFYGLTGPFQNYIQNPAPPSCKYISFMNIVNADLIVIIMLMMIHLQIPLNFLALWAKVNKLLLP